MNLNFLHNMRIYTIYVFYSFINAVWWNKTLINFQKRFSYNYLPLNELVGLLNYRYWWTLSHIKAKVVAASRKGFPYHHTLINPLTQKLSFVLCMCTIAFMNGYNMMTLKLCSNMHQKYIIAHWMAENSGMPVCGEYFFQISWSLLHNASFLHCSCLVGRVSHIINNTLAISKMQATNFNFSLFRESIYSML